MKTRKTLIGGMSADAILLTFIKLITMTMGLATTRLLSQYLSVHDYGTYSQILLIVSTVSSFTIFGMLDGMKFFACKELDKDKRESYIATIFVLQLLLGTVVGSVVMLLSAPLCAYFSNPSIKSLLIFAATLPMLQNLIGVLQVLIVSIGEARKLAIRNIFVAVMRLATVLCIVLKVRNVALLMAITLLLDVCQVGYFLFALRKSGYSVRFLRTDFRLLGEIFRYCTPMAIFILVSSLNRDVDKYLISTMTDTETLAMYANASKQLPFDVILSSFGTVLAPQITRLLAQDAKHDASRLYKVFLEITYISTGILCCAALSVAPQLMKLLYSDKYMSGIGIFVIYLFVDLMRFTNATIVMAAAGKTRLLMVLGSCAVLANAALNMIFYRAMGIIGPAVATLVVTVVVGMIMLYLDARILNTRMRQLFDKKYLFIFALESIVLTVILNMVSRALDKLGVHYVVTILTVAGMYGVFMLLLNGKRLLKDCAGLDYVSAK